MRIVLIFLIGLVLAFFGGEVVARAHRGIKILRPLPSINHTFVALAILISGLGIFFLGQSYFGDPTNILIATLLFGAALGAFFYQVLNRGYILSEKVEREFFRRHETKVDRVLEMLPGVLTWLALLSPIWLSFTLPFAVAYLIVLADVYWLFSSIRYTVLIFIGYRKMNWVKKQNWLKKLKTDFPEDWSKYYQLILIPTYKESIEILAPAFDAIVNSDYPKDKIMILVGYESRDTPEKIEATNEYLKKHVEGKIGQVFTTVHPFGLPGEVPGQGSNKNWMINQTTPQLKKLGIKTDDVYVTTLDADFVIHHQFLAGALHKYLATPADKRDFATYTGVFLFHNNYWQSPAPTRLIATGTGFWQLSEMVGSDKYINYSSLSINLKFLLDIGLWIPNKVNDDSGFYWKAYYHTLGKYKVIPHFLPISADAVLDVNLFKTFTNQYLQLKRWAYGVEHIPFIFKKYFTTKMDFWDKTDKLTFIIWSYFKWGTLALFITFGGLLIPLVNPGYSQTVISKNLTIVSSWILTIAFIGLFVTVIVNEKTAPKRPKNWNLLQRVWSYLQWVLIPVVLVTITTIPAIDAQTSLMMGRYIEFRVTNKAR